MYLAHTCIGVNAAYLVGSTIPGTAQRPLGPDELETPAGYALISQPFFRSLTGINDKSQYTQRTLQKKAKTAVVALVDQSLMDNPP